MIRRCFALVALVAVALGSAPLGASAAQSGEPLVIGLVTSEEGTVDVPDARQGVEAAVKYVNRSLDGVDGRPLKLVTCNDKGDPGASTTCAQEMIDAGVLAVWSASPVFSDAGVPALSRAGIPYQGFPNGAGAFTSPTSYPLIGGALSGFPALAKYFATEEKVEKVGILAAEINVAKLGANLTKDTLAQYGVTDVNQVDEQLGAADFSSAVARVNDGDPDVIIVLFAADDCPRILEAAQQTGVQAKLAFAATCLDQTRVFDVAGEAAQGTFYESSVLPYTDAKSKDVRTFRKQLRKFAKAAPSFLAETGFSWVMTLRDWVTQVGAASVTPASYLEFIKAASGLEIFAGPEYTAGEGPPIAPQVFNTGDRIVRLEGKKLVDVGGGWVDGWDA
jgi:branched-chain amino acid transport system substrate-binding protein